jgi:protein TonB
MELKKNKAYELTKLRGLFFNIGLVITLIAVITAFEWKFYDDGQLVSLGTVNDDFEEMLEIPPTEQPPPPPPKIQQPIIVEKLKKFSLLLKRCQASQAECMHFTNI